MLVKLLKEPLLHFIIIALLFFVAYQQINPAEEDDFTISVSEGRMALLKNQFTERWKREPLAKELQNSAQLYAINEMYLREAKALGMDQNDVVIDRRLKQKMDYMLDDLSAVKQATDAEINAFYTANSDRYRASAVYSFEQVYLSTDRSQEAIKQIQADNEALLAAGTPPKGDQTLLPKTLRQQSVFQIERRFGKQFTAGLEDLQLDQWQGPIPSGLGLHYTLITAKTPAALKPLAAVRQEVIQDLAYQKKNALVKVFEQKLQEKYTVEYAQPTAVTAQ